MFNFYTIIFFGSFSFFRSAYTDTEESFRGAVVEYGAKISNSSKNSVLLNINSYKEIVETLKNKYFDLDIIVFPENGLSLNASDVYAEEIPEPELSEIPCENNSTEALRHLSCIAKNNSLYLVVNLAEKSATDNGTYFYNTNVAFSRTGAVIARYRKFNIYGYQGKPFHKTDEPDISYFDTDFGVRFGTFTCFDIDFKSPALDLVYEHNITHIVFPTAWISELPYLTALQVQSGWAYSTNTILMASGYNDPQRGSTGTGIFFGKLPYKETFDELSLQNQVKGDFAIVSYVPKSPNTTSYFAKSDIHYFYNTIDPEKAPLKLLKDHLHLFTTKLVEDSTEYKYISDRNILFVESNTEINETLCDRGLCCEFTFKMKKRYGLDVIIKLPDPNGDNFGQFKYRLAVFNGVRSYGGGLATGGVQVCSVISCVNDDARSCGERTENIDPNSIVTKLGVKYIQYSTQFYDVNIKANLSSSNSTFVSSNILLSSNDFYPVTDGENIRFGKTADSRLYEISRVYDNDASQNFHLLESKGYIYNPASINLYNRMFDLDGQNATFVDDDDSANKNNGVIYRLALYLLFISSYATISAMLISL